MADVIGPLMADHSRDSVELLLPRGLNGIAVLYDDGEFGDVTVTLLHDAAGPDRVAHLSVVQRKVLAARLAAWADIIDPPEDQNDG